ncbi:hypothetical protein OBBRIDRAFT_829433 [Obba rivulosa]|uniref:Cation/H+ exchanger transmembrane domain-containing protein n=1 Tax=Obba rivulosa TaxID=1052685 RepID=A0A8E2DE72_9APHY|nr:hypothetical protein OBBRIDRAFT_829433 [Obba rivulosa]
MTLSSSFPYSQPSLVSLLVILSFLYLLNVIFVLANLLAHAGIVGQIFLGTVYGSPLGGMLALEWEATFGLLGYLGLVCIVFEGGLSTNLSHLFSNLPLSCLCAMTGVACPIALSFALLQAAFGYSPLEAFAAGAALSSTSLGTTFAALSSVSRQEGAFVGAKGTIDEAMEGETFGSTAPHAAFIPETLRSAGASRDSILPESSSHTHKPAKPSLQQSRIGTVLISAAMIDDVIGLVISAIIPAISSEGSLSGHPSLAWRVIKPILSSTLIAAISPPVARFILRPTFWYRRYGELWCAPRTRRQPDSAQTLSRTLIRAQAWSEAQADFVKVTLMVFVASAYIAIAYYTDSSMLFGAYIAGITLTYICQIPTKDPSESPTPSQQNTEHVLALSLSFEDAYSRKVGPIQNYILAPLFFASIGYAIPFLSLWNGKVLWRGILYSVLMVIGKLAVGLPILLWSVLPAQRTSGIVPQTRGDRYITQIWRAITHMGLKGDRCPRPRSESELRTIDTTEKSHDHRTSVGYKLRTSLLPATFIGLAMVARGEIGLLIAQIARGRSDSSANTMGLLGDEAFLVCIWAILLCTIVGPISVGILVRRAGNSLVTGNWA